jgi:hypothetical protein
MLSRSITTTSLPIGDLFVLAAIHSQFDLSHQKKAFFHETTPRFYPH